MVNVRSHDPFSGHTPVLAAGTDPVGDTGDEPKQPTRPGHHPPPPVVQPPVVQPPVDGLDDMLKSDLVDLAGAMGLPKSGTKDELITRIRADRAHSPR